MSGLLALLDDVAAIAKVAAASVDDVAAAAGKAGAKAAGVIIDDAAVTPKYVQGFAPARELPIIWRIARGSFFNKLVVLLPLAMLMANFAPWLVTPLLMVGGCYLCFEGAEKVYHVLAHRGHDDVEAKALTGNVAQLEEQKVRGAIKTDFILSAEIMTITLAAIEAPNVWMQGATLAVVAIGITVVIYGSVGLIVKMDDVGLYLAGNARTSIGQGIGRGLVQAMPGVLKTLTVVGTAAMLWVGGSIIMHGLKDLGWPVIYDWIHHVAHTAVAAISGPLAKVLEWVVVAGFDGVLGLAIGLVLIPLASRIFTPLWQGFAPRAPGA